MMTCESIDLKGYVLGEAAESERESVERHVSACRSCGDELERLRITQAVLASVRDEELPKRIAFVSDKIFEPKWWQFLWSGPRWGFASAALLAAAIVAHGYMDRPVAVAPVQTDTAIVQGIIEKEVSQRLPEAVAKAVATADARSERKTAELLAAAEKKFEARSQEDRLYFAQNLEVMTKRMNVMHLASAWPEREGRPSQETESKQ